MTRGPKFVHHKDSLNSSFVIDRFYDKTFLQINIPSRLNKFPHQVSNFTNVTCTSVSGILLLHSAATLHRTSKHTFMELILKTSINLDAKLVVELLCTSTSATQAISGIGILIRSRTTHRQLLQRISILSPLRASLPSSSFLPYTSALS